MPAMARRMGRSTAHVVSRLRGRVTHSYIQQPSSPSAQQLCDFGIPSPGDLLSDVLYGPDSTPAQVPRGIVKKVERGLEAPIDEHIERGTIGSAEVLAQVLPQISSHVAAATIDDPQLQTVYAAIYAAFRRRRSLLLLNLEHQVRLEELPWVAPINKFRVTNRSSKANARETLAQATLLTITSFPQTIFPNPLISEFTALARSADIDIPFVEELAADIFMGTFTTKWRDAARLTAEGLGGTLYAAYFDLPAPSTWSPTPSTDSTSGVLEKVRRLRFPKETADTFAALCHQRATEAGTSDGNYVTRNGAVIEQSQILTTHNLAPTVQRLDVVDRLAPTAARLALGVFDWIITEQTTPRPSSRAMLPVLKNTAYAWRQAIYLMSLTDDVAQRATLSAMRSKWAAAPADWQERFEPVLTGLENVQSGASFDDSGQVGLGRRFLGWSTGAHWLMPPVPARPV